MNTNGTEQAFQLPREQEIEIVGTQYDDRPQHHAGLYVGQELMLLPETDNPHDANAILVCTLDRRPLGHLPALWAARYRPFLQNQQIQFDVRVTQADAVQYQDRPLLAVVITAHTNGVGDMEKQLAQMIHCCVKMKSDLYTEYMTFPELPEEKYDPAYAIQCLHRLRVLTAYHTQLSEKLPDMSFDAEEDETPASFPAAELHEALTQCAVVLSLMEREQRALRNQIEDIEDDDEYERQTVQIRKRIKKIKSERETALLLLEINDKLLADAGQNGQAPAEQTAPQPDTPKSTGDTELHSVIVHMKRAYGRYEYNADGIYNENGLTVLAWSKIQVHNGSYQLGSKEIENLRKNAEIVDAAGVLKRDVHFNSVDEAASFVVGKKRDGLYEWITDEHKSLNLYVNEQKKKSQVQTTPTSIPPERIPDEPKKQPPAASASAKTETKTDALPARPAAADSAAAKKPLPDSIRGLFPVAVYLNSPEGEYQADGSYNGSELTVLAGSKICLRNGVCLPDEHDAFRDLVISLDAHAVLTKDVSFSTASAAASVVCGKPTIGFLEWKTASGQSLYDFLTENKALPQAGESMLAKPSVKPDSVPQQPPAAPAPAQAKTEAKPDALPESPAEVDTAGLEKPPAAPPAKTPENPALLPDHFTVIICGIEKTVASWSEAFAELCETLIIRYPYAMATAPIWELHKSDSRPVFSRRSVSSDYRRLSNAVYVCPVESYEELTRIVFSMRFYIAGDYTISLKMEESGNG